MKPVAWLTTLFLALVALTNVLHLVFPVEMVAGGVRVPLWASALARMFTSGLATLLWREGHR